MRKRKVVKLPTNEPVRKRNPSYRSRVRPLKVKEIVYVKPVPPAEFKAGKMLQAYAISVIQHIPIGARWVVIAGGTEKSKSDMRPCPPAGIG